MDFARWQQMVRQAGGDTRMADQNWLYSQYQMQQAPIVVARMIQAGAFVPAQPTQRRMPTPVMPSIQLGDPRAMRFPTDYTEWRWTLYLTSVGFLLLFFYAAFSLATVNDLAQRFASMSTSPIEYFVKKAWWAVLLVIGLCIFIRRLFLFSPFPSIHSRTYLTWMAVLCALVALAVQFTV
ncbi:MAG: hypothetical protein GC165_00350 [Armatimonadetes bacterium]|nr:hypothetical protein [Armatimonadota bacterium]